MSEASIYRWMKQKSFQTALRAARRDILAHTTTRRHRRHHRTTQNPRSATAEPSEWISRGRKQLQSRGRKPAVKRPEEPGMWPTGGFRIPAAQVRPRARPRILFATSGQAGSDRVEVGIGQRCHQMIATQCTRKEAILPQVSAAAVEPVKSLGISRVRSLHRSCQCILPLGHGHQVNMIRHQAVAENPWAIASAVFAESFQIESPVFVSLGETEFCGIIAAASGALHERPRMIISRDEQAWSR